MKTVARRKLAIAFFASFLLGSIAFAETLVCEDALKAGSAFRNGFAAPSLYKAGRCHENVYLFIKTLQTSGVDVSTGQVLIFQDFRMYNIRTDQNSIYARTHLQDQANVSGLWNYHVVFYLKGKVFDFDFTNSAKPVSMRFYLAWALDYFDRLDKSSAEKLSDSRVIQTASASEYVRHFSDVERWLSMRELIPHVVTPPVFFHKQKLQEFIESTEVLGR